MTAPPGFDMAVALSNVVSHTVFEPLFTGPLLAYTLKLIPQISEHLLPDIFNRIAPYIDRTKTIAILATLFGIGILRKTNDFLTDRTANNWVSDVYDWKKEIVVVTGGSSGLGEWVAKDLGRRGIKVAIIDIVEPKYELRMIIHLLPIPKLQLLTQTDTKPKHQHANSSNAISPPPPKSPTLPKPSAPPSVIQRSS